MDRNSSKKTILVLSPYVFGVGGVAVAVNKLSREFANCGWRVIHMTKGSSVFPRRSEGTEFPTVCVNFRIPYGTWKSLIAFVAMLAVNAAYLTRFFWLHRVNAVLIQYPIPGYFLIAFLCRLLRIPCCLTFQGSDAHRLGGLGWQEARLMRWLITQSHSITAVSHSLSQKVMAFQSTSKSKLSIIPNGTPSISDRTSRKLRKERPFAICGAGKLIPRKGFDVLIEAVYLLRRSGISITCKIVGEGPQREELNALINEYGMADSITLTGNMEHDCVLEQFSQCDAFVLSSRAEGAALVLVEAMSCGCAIVATNVDGALDTITHRKNGLLVEVDNPRHLAEALIELKSNDELRATLMQNARVTAAEYTWEKIVQRYLSVLSTNSAAAKSPVS